METSITAALGPVHPLVALSSTVLILEIVIVVVVVALLVAILVINQRRKSPKAPAPAAPAQNAYPGLPQQDPVAGQAAGFAPAGPAGQPDPFAGFSAGPAAAPPAAPAAPPPPPAPAPAPAGPPPGTPAGWLPDPSGAPNTLRYWDGSAWTQHVAQRS